MTLRGIVFGLGVFFLLPAVAHADSVYTFNTSLTKGPNTPSTFAWSFDVPSFLTTTTVISSLLSESVTGVLGSDGCVVAFVAIINPASEYDVQTNFRFGCPFRSVTFSDPDTPILGPGTFGFASPFGSNFLTVTSSTAPEPSSLLLLGTGLLGLGPFIRRAAMS